MCGIAGIVAADRLTPREIGQLPVMRDVITHRGPDESGLYCDEVAGLAHRRLSIVDLAAGQQPLANEDDSIWIVFNGEIYNHAEIRRLLESAGHRYKTRCDTETILHAYEEWGDRALERFRGMFAFAIWDRPRRRLLLARDRLGIKPLYWTIVRDRLVFGSEIKAVLESGLVETEANEAAIPELLSTRYLSGTETLFKGIHRLLPGHLLVFEDGRARTSMWWDVPSIDHQAAHDPLSERETVDRFRHALEEAVRTRLMADVPLGMFLSGGLDSSAIAALMARMIDRPLQTFSVAFEQRAYSELEYARQVSRAIGADAHEVVINDSDFFGALPRLVWHEDEPIAHPSSVPLFFVSRLASEHVKVVLTGEGSDELLAGYGKYPGRSSIGGPGDSGRSRRSPCDGSSLGPSCPGCPRRSRVMRRDPFWPCLTRPRRSSSTTSRRSVCAGNRRSSTHGSRPCRPGARRTTRRAPISTLDRKAPTRWTACSTPTSRPTWSNCS